MVTIASLVLIRYRGTLSNHGKIGGKNALFCERRTSLWRGNSEVTAGDEAMKDPSNPICRTISTLLSRIGDKWTVLVVQTLGSGPRRFNELRREIPSVSQRMLTLTLRNLERDGLVSRTVTPTIPPRVDYELTPLGHSLEKPICGLATWALENVGSIHEAQAHFDGEHDKAAAA
jgi:DNA-binding HxlR family transcriptional regulator